MIFKTLVECIIQRQRDPDDTLALNALNSLTREIQNDLIQAFGMSQPLVDRHAHLFWESRSYLDFLIKLSKLPLDTDYYARRKELPTEPFHEKNQETVPLKNIFHGENVDLKRKLDECLESNKKLHETLEACDAENGTLQQRLKTAREKYEATFNDLGQCETDKETIIREYDKENKDLHQKLMQCKEELETAKQEMRMDTQPELLTKEALDSFLSKYERQEKLLQTFLERNQELTTKDQLAAEAYNDLRTLANNLYIENQSIRNFMNDLTLHLLQPTPSFELPPTDGSPESMQNSNQPIVTSQAALEPSQAALEPSQAALESSQAALESCPQYIRDPFIVTEVQPSETAAHAIEWKNLQTQLNDTQDQLRRCKAELNDTQDQLRRCKAELEQTKAQLHACEAELEQTKNQLHACEAKLEQTKNQLHACEAELEQTRTEKEAQFEEYQTNLDVQTFNKNNDRKLLQQFQSELDRLQQAMDIVLDVHTFVNIILEQIQTLPKQTHYLADLASATKLAIDEQFVPAITQRLKAYDFALQLHKQFPALSFEEWVRTFPLHLEALRKRMPEIEQRDWLQHGTLWLENLQFQFDANERIMGELMALTPEIKITTNLTRWYWKNIFVERYEMLLHTVQALIGPQKLDVLPKELERLRRNVMNDDILKEPNWLMMYIEWLEKATVKETHKDKSWGQKPYNKLQQQCENLAGYFKIPLKQATFYQDVLGSNWMKEQIQQKSTIRGLGDYFAVRILGAETVITAIDTLLKSMAIPVAIPRPETFEQHLRSYWEAWAQALRTEKDAEWLRDLNLPPNTPKEMYREILQTKLVEEWKALYTMWLKELNLDAETPKEEFLAQWKKAGKREKRGSGVLSGEYSIASSEKKLKLQGNWSDLEMQNVFAAFYKEYFSLKWDHVNIIIPDAAMFRNKVEQKLQILDQINPNERASGLLDIYTRYVNFDLELLNKRPQIFTEITSISSILEKSMKETERYLERLAAKCGRNELSEGEMAGEHLLSEEEMSEN